MMAIESCTCRCCASTRNDRECVSKRGCPRKTLRWTGGAYTAPLLYPGGRLSVEEFQKIFQDDIDKSIELEKQDAKQ